MLNAISLVVETTVNNRYKCFNVAGAIVSLNCKWYMYSKGGDS